MITPRQLQALYKQGANISHLLRKEHNVLNNTDEIIEIAYDLQTGSYTAAMENAEISAHKRDYSSEIAKVIKSLCKPRSICEAGVGEATTLSGVLKSIGSDVSSFGFDLSWSRVAYAKKWLHANDIANATLCTGNLFHIPFADSSIDVVYTSHSIEPNGGNEKSILQELFRVAKKFLVLLEPGYELANEEARQRMDSHGYCKGLRSIAESLGYRVLRHELFPFSANPLNPTAITIIQKDDDEPVPSHILACPRFKTPLEKMGSVLFSPEALVAYPILNDIPCLRIDNGIFASKYIEICEL